MDWLEKSKKNIQETKESKKEEERRSYDPKSSGMDPELMGLQKPAGKKVSVKEPQKTVALKKINKVPENKGKEEKKERTLVVDESRQEVKKELSLKERRSIYNDKEKDRRVQLLIEKEIPVPKDRDDLISLRAEYMEYVYLVNAKGDYLLNSEGQRRQDQAWKPDTKPIIVENYEWLMQYFTVHDASIDKNKENDKAIPAIEFKDHEVSMDIPGMKDVYESQGTSNCYACTGTAMINQFIAMRKNEETITRRVDQYDMRAYRPMIRKYDPSTEKVMDEVEYAGNVANVNLYAGKGKRETGNIFALGDFMLDTLEKNGISDVMLNRMVFRDPKIDRSKGDNKHDLSVHNNMQAVFADKIAEIIGSGAIAGILIQQPGYSHYVTVTGIKGNELTVYDSAGYHGKSDKMDISSILQRGRTVEINWLSDMKKPDEMTKEYQNLQYDPQTGYSLKKVSHSELGESATHTKGITVLKEGVEMGEAYEQIAQFSYIPDPLVHVEKQTVEEALDIQENKQETLSEEIKEEKKEAVSEEIKEEKKEAVSEEAKEEKNSVKKLSSAKRKKVSLDSGLDTIKEINEKKWEDEDEKHEKKLKEDRERYEKLKIQEREAKKIEAERYLRLKEYNAKQEEERVKQNAKTAEEIKVRSVIEGDFSKSKRSVRKKAVKTQKAFEKAYKDYQTFGLGSDLRNTDIVAGDRRYMRGVKTALAAYLSIRDALFEKYGYAEMKAEDIGVMNMRTYEGAEARKKAFKQKKSAVYYNIFDQDTMENDWRMRNLTEDETKKLGDAYEAVNEAAKDYLDHHSHFFKFGRGRSRVKQVRRLRDRLQLDNIRFGLSSERRKINASIDKKYSKETQSLRRELHPTWHKCVLFNDLIDAKEIGHREKRRRQRAEGKVPAWYKRVWSWTNRGFKNNICRLLMAYNGLGGLIDRGLGLATAVVANTISLAGKTVKLPLKAISCIFNGISSLRGSKKRWDVSVDPRKDWKSIDDGRKIFRRYLKGACILPAAVVETLVRGLPSLFGHYFKSGVYKRTGRWTKAIFADIKRVAEGVGIKDYTVADRAVEDTLMAGYITVEGVNGPRVLHEGVTKTYRSKKVLEAEDEYEDPEKMTDEESESEYEEEKEEKKEEKQEEKKEEKQKEKQEEKKEEKQEEKKEEKQEEKKEEKQEEKKEEKQEEKKEEKQEEKKEEKQEFKEAPVYWRDVEKVKKELEDRFKDSGIKKKDLEDLKETVATAQMISEQYVNAIPDDKLQEFKNATVYGNDSRGLLFTLRPVKLDKNGNPATEQDRKNREQNIIDTDNIMKNTLADRKAYLDRVAADLRRITFTPEQLADDRYIRDHREEAIRFIGLMHNFLNTYNDHAEYYQNCVDPQTKIFLFLMVNGTDYFAYASHRISAVLYRHGLAGAETGTSSAQIYSVGYTKGSDYKKLLEENDKLAEMSENEAANEASLFHNCVKKGLDPYDENNVEEREMYLKMAGNFSHYDLNGESIFMEESGKAQGVYKKHERREVTLQYMKEFFEKKDDPVYISNMLKLIDRFAPITDKSNISNSSGVKADELKEFSGKSGELLKRSEDFKKEAFKGIDTLVKTLDKAYNDQYGTFKNKSKRDKTFVTNKKAFNRSVAELAKLGGIDDKEAVDIMLGIRKGENAKTVQEKQTRAKSFEALFKVIKDFDLKKMKFASFDELLSGDKAEVALMTDAMMGIHPEVMSEYEHMLKDKNYGCSLSQKQFNKIKAKWDFLRNCHSWYNEFSHHRAVAEKLGIDIAALVRMPLKELTALMEKDHESKEKSDLYKCCAYIAQNREKTGFDMNVKAEKLKI